MTFYYTIFFFFSSRRRHTRSLRDWSSDVCSSDLRGVVMADGALSVPNNTNWSEWSFGQVLLAITGDSIDFKKALDVDWFKFSTSGGTASDDVSYHAWEKYYFGASYNYQAMTDW